MRCRSRLGVASWWTLSSLFLPAMAVAQPLSFAHFAGPLGGPGLVDGTGTSASFNHPGGVAADGSGNLYVADTANNAIRKITPGGVVTTLAGTGAYGSEDGTGPSASFGVPYGIAVDGAGNVYVADTYNNRIRKVTFAGAVTTLAGSGAAGSADGPGTAASFSSPTGVAVDGSGNVYVADNSSNRIRRVAPGGTVTTIAGSGAPTSSDGTGTGASFAYPAGIAVDSSGNIYVSDSGSSKIRKITPAGVVTTLAGGAGYGSIDGPGSTATFSSPYGMAVDGSGNVYVADQSTHKVRRITPGGLVSTLAGSGKLASTDGTGASAAFNTPMGVAADFSGNVYVADAFNNKVRKITPAGAVTTVAGSGASGSADGAGPAATFSSPSGVATDGAGAIYVADTLSRKIRKVSPGAVVTTLAGSGEQGSVDGPGASASFADPRGVAVDGAGNVYVADLNGNKIRKVTPGGVVTTLAGSGSQGSADGTGAGASFHSPNGVAADAFGNVYVADTLNQKIRKVTPGGVVTTLAGSGTAGAVDGTGSAASFANPKGVAVDQAGNVYVADMFNRKIRKITSGGLVTTLAGSGAASNEDGTGSAATFTFPHGVAVDGSGTVWVADLGSYRIRRVTAGGVVTTVAGSGQLGNADGTGSTATFYLPQGIATDGSGNVYVADTENNAIRVGRSMGSASCTPDDGHLCLLGGRFRISADYTDYGSGHGTGKAMYLTPDTGYFWFFNAANVEAVAKMVSFCGGGSNNVAIYAGGLTDLGVTLHVTDTRNATTRDYTNPLGTGFGLIRDGPFGCPAGATEIGELGPSAASSPGDPIVETTSWAEPGLQVQAVCTLDAKTLCLLNGRFQVRAAYQDYSGHTGDGQAVPLTFDTGHFWFFGASNVETVVKMVSFCGGGSNNVGVYAGGLTDIQVTLTVTDTQTGLVKTYTNPLGTPFQLIREGPFSCP